MVGRSAFGMKRALALAGGLALTFTAACGGSATTAEFERAAGISGESALAVDTPAAGAAAAGGADGAAAATTESTAAPGSAEAGVGGAAPSGSVATAAGAPAGGTSASQPRQGSAATSSRTAGAGAGSAAGSSAGTGAGPAKAGQGAGGAGAATPSTPGGSAAPGKSDNSPIKIGAICNCSGPAGSSEAPPLDALRAWVQFTNAKGGINGHPVELMVVDDRSDPSRARAAAQDMVENRGVIAIVSPFAVLTHSGLGPYLKEKRIPLIGGDHASDNYCQNPMYFPQGTCREGWAWGGLRALAEQFKERNLGVLVCVESDICPFTLDVAKKYAASLGFKLVYSGQASIASPDFSAQCLSAKSAGVDVLLIQMELNSMRRIGGQCGRQAFRPKYGSFQQDITFLSVPEYEGMPLGNQTFSYSYEGPETVDFRKALAQYAPNASNGGYFANAWAAAKVFEKAASQVKGAVTSEAILEQLWTFKNETVGGLTVPLTYVKDQPTVPPFCVYVTTVGKGKIDAPYGLKPLCK